VSVPKGLLIDLDGVIYEDDSPIAGAAGALEWIRSRHIPHVFLTNTTSVPRRALREKLAHAGIPIERDEQIVTPARAAMSWLRRNPRAPVALFVPHEVREDFAHLELIAEDAHAGAAAVVFGDLGEGWTFAALNRALRLLLADPQSVLIALGTTRFWLARDGLRLDVGPFVAAMESATGREALVLGKPAPMFFDLALTELGCSAAEAMMIGDDLLTDIGGAQRIGARGMLVRTGKFRVVGLSSSATVRPDVLLDSIAQLPAWWSDSLSRHRERIE